MTTATTQLPCGSHGRYLQHLKTGEDCTECREGNRRRMAAFRASRPDQRERDRKQDLVRNAATSRLIAAHGREYEQLLHEERRRVFQPARTKIAS